MFYLLNTSSVKYLTFVMSRFERKLLLPYKQTSFAYSTLKYLVYENWISYLNTRTLQKYSKRIIWQKSKYICRFICSDSKDRYGAVSHRLRVAARTWAYRTHVRWRLSFDWRRSEIVYKTRGTTLSGKLSMACWGTFLAFRQAYPEKPSSPHIATLQWFLCITLMTLSILRAVDCILTSARSKI